MSDEPTNLVLEHLRIIRGELGEVRATQREHTHRLNELQVGIAGCRRDIVHTDETIARMQVGFDRFNDRLERVEHRLELRDA